MIGNVEELKMPEEPIYYPIGRFLQECGYNISYIYQTGGYDLRNLGPEDCMNIDKPLSGPKKQITGGAQPTMRMMYEMVKIGELTGLSNNNKQWSLAVFGQNYMDEIRLLAQRLSQKFDGATIKIQLVQTQENIHAHRQR